MWYDGGGELDGMKLLGVPKLGTGGKVEKDLNSSYLLLETCR